MQKLFWTVLIILIARPVIGAEQKYISDTVSILFNTVENSASNSQLSVLKELGQYLRYALEQKGYESRTYLPIESSLPVSSPHHQIYSVSVDVSYSKKPVTLTDAHRRRTFHQSDSLFTITLSGMPMGGNRDSDAVIKEITEQAKIDWIDSPLSRKDHNKMRQQAEPREFVLQRAAYRLIQELPSQRRTIPDATYSLPVYWYIDSSYIKEHGKNWEQQLEKTHKTVSIRLQAQFDVVLETKQIQTITIPTEDTYSIERVLKGVKAGGLDKGAGLHIYLFSRSVTEEYFLKEKYENVGLAEIGQKRIIINDIPLPRANEYWQPYYTSIIFLHEFGHAMGAIHVSDQQSVMNHSINLASGGYFDSMNRRIINQAVSGTLRFVSHQEYINIVINAIEEATYQLADIPWVAYHFLIKNDLYTSEKAFLSKPKYRMYYYAGLGYSYMLKDNREKAADLFRDAIDNASFAQGSLYYYLAGTASEQKEREQAISAASTLGYYLARTKKLATYVRP